MLRNLQGVFVGIGVVKVKELVEIGRAKQGNWRELVGIGTIFGYVFLRKNTPGQGNWSAPRTLFIILKETTVHPRCRQCCKAGASHSRILQAAPFVGSYYFDMYISIFRILQAAPFVGSYYFDMYISICVSTPATSVS